jgi:hypothetical protein
MFSADNRIMIQYKTDADGKLIELNVDRLLTVEQMVLLNPNIDFNLTIEGFTGDIFVKPNNSCTEFSNDVLMPINIEVGNTRYKYDEEDCTYKTVDNYNEFRPGFSDDYYIRDTIPVSANTKISVIIYNPDELVDFIEIYELPNTYESIGIYNVMFNLDRNGFDDYLFNYYRDMGIYEQLYLKHQENDGAINEVLGLSTDINLMDLDNIDEVIALIDDFESIYEDEIAAIEEMQLLIGIGFDEDAGEENEGDPEGDTNTDEE